MTSPCWSNEKIIKFIDAVRSRVCLWDSKSTEYKNRYLKKEEWTALALEFQISQVEAKRKFRNLRTYFNTELKKLIDKQQQHLSGPLQDSNWFAFKAMVFLKGKDDSDTPETHLDQIAVKEENFLSDDSDDGIMVTPNIMQPQIPSSTNITTTSSSLVTTTIKRRKRSIDHPDIDERIFKNIDEITKESPKKISAFAEHVNQKLFSYSDHVRNQVEFKIATILYEADMGCYDEQK